MGGGGVVLRILSHFKECCNDAAKPCALYINKRNNTMHKLLASQLALHNSSSFSLSYHIAVSFIVIALKCAQK